MLKWNSFCLMQWQQFRWMQSVQSKMVYTNMWSQFMWSCNTRYCSNFGTHWKQTTDAQFYNKKWITSNNDDGKSQCLEYEISVLHAKQCYRWYFKVQKHFGIFQNLWLGRKWNYWSLSFYWNQKTLSSTEWWSFG